MGIISRMMGVIIVAIVLVLAGVLYLSESLSDILLSWIAVRAPWGMRKGVEVWRSLVVFLTLHARILLGKVVEKILPTLYRVFLFFQPRISQ